jgi:hypothetical protein
MYTFISTTEMGVKIGIKELIVFRQEKSTLFKGRILQKTKQKTEGAEDNELACTHNSPDLPKHNSKTKI